MDSGSTEKPAQPEAILKKRWKKKRHIKHNPSTLKKCVFSKLEGHNQSNDCKGVDFHSSSQLDLLFDTQMGKLSEALHNKHTNVLALQETDESTVAREFLD